MIAHPQRVVAELLGPAGDRQVLGPAHLALDLGELHADAKRPARVDWRNVHQGSTFAERVAAGSERWSGRRDSNPRPRAPKARALPNCATPRSPDDTRVGPGARSGPVHGAWARDRVGTWARRTSGTPTCAACPPRRRAGTRTRRRVNAGARACCSQCRVSHERARAIRHTSRNLLNLRFGRARSSKSCSRQQRADQSGPRSGAGRSWSTSRPTPRGTTPECTLRHRSAPRSVMGC